MHPPEPQHPAADHDNAPAACVDDLLRELVDLRASLEHSHRLATLGTITGSIAHEFNNILTPVLGYAEAALANPEDRVLVERALRQAAGGAERASRIASAILAFARPSGVPRGTEAAGGGASADVGRVLRETLLCLGQDRGGGRVVVETDVQDGVVAAVEPVVLQQVLMNLLLNAFAALKQGGGKVAIRGKRVGGAGRSTWNTKELKGKNSVSAHKHTTGWVEIVVDDNGPGMEAELVTRVFEPFGGKGASGDSGTGLGLSICRRMVEGGGGEMSVESAPGKGAKFTIRLPAARAAGDVRKAG